MRLEQREIGIGIGAEQACGHAPPVRKGNFERAGAIDDVVVGDDQPVGRDRHAGPHAASFRDNGRDRWPDTVGDRGDGLRIAVEQNSIVNGT